MEIYLNDLFKKKSKTIQYSDQNLTEIPKNIPWSDFKTKVFLITRVELKNNKLNSLHGLESLKKIRNLNISGNSFEKLSIEPWRDLQVLNASHNKLTTVSYLKKHKCIKALILNHNLFSKIPRVHPSNEINTLILKNNKISSVKGIELYKYLKKLNLSHNTLKDFPKVELKDLMSLDISFNQISTIGSVDCFEKLTELKLHNNHLEIFPLNCMMKSLKILTTVGNPFQEDVYPSDSVLKLLPFLKKYNQFVIGEEPNLSKRKVESEGSSKVRKISGQRVVVNRMSVDEELNRIIPAPLKEDDLGEELSSTLSGYVKKDEKFSGVVKKKGSQRRLKGSTQAKLTEYLNNEFYTSPTTW